MDCWSHLESPEASPAAKRRPPPAARPTSTPSLLGRAACLRTLPRLQSYTHAHPVLEFVDACLRGIGQTTFQNSPLTGLLFLVAFSLSTRGHRLVLFALIGVASGTSFSKLMGLDRSLRSAGLHGYNAALVGCAVHTFFHSDVFVGTAVVVIVGLSVVTVLLAAATAAALPPGLPTLTFPFQAAMWLYALGSQLYPRLQVMDLAPQRFVINTTISAAPYDTTSVVHAIFAGIAETCLVSDWVSGVVMLLGIALCSPIGSIAALLASAAATLLAVAIDAPPAGVYLGLHGYNPVLIAMALSGFFLAPQHWRTAVVVVLGVGATFLADCATGSLFTLLGLPVLTWPFTVMTWACLLATEAMPDVTRVPLGDLTTPEEHYERQRCIDVV
ncbi:urea transporter [Achlya hypogyna]|uniref:Urea transporter n=1 Tax=Achlya hypogyna TaxID=1202772 RepID=A0A1V9ZPQ0_ACHHY|nr:urea transporter [Achlya hypogyna]